MFSTIVLFSFTGSSHLPEYLDLIQTLLKTHATAIIEKTDLLEP